MAETDTAGKVVGITRIDFGARERYAIARQANADLSPVQTSKKYASSGQMGKDYIKYLLKDTDIKYKYLSLWKQTHHAHEIATHVETNFKNQLNKLPESAQRDAIKGLIATINKGAPKNQIWRPEQTELKQLISEIAEKMGKISANRVEAMHNQALKIEVTTKHANSVNTIDKVIATLEKYKKHLGVTLPTTIADKKKQQVSTVISNLQAGRGRDAHEQAQLLKDNITDDFLEKIGKERFPDSKRVEGKAVSSLLRQQFRVEPPEPPVTPLEVAINESKLARKQRIRN